MDYKIIQRLHQLINTFDFLGAPIKFLYGNLKEYQNKVLKIHPHHTSFAPKWIHGYPLPSVKYNGNRLRQGSVYFS